jgi:hypothetical protein
MVGTVEQCEPTDEIIVGGVRYRVAWMWPNKSAQARRFDDAAGRFTTKRELLVHIKNGSTVTWEVVA